MSGGRRPSVTVTPNVVTSPGRSTMRLDGRERQDDGGVDETVAGVVQTRHAEPPSLDVDRFARLEAERAGAGVAEERLLAPWTAAGDDHEPARRKLVRVVTEDELRIPPLHFRHAQEDAGHFVDAVDAGDAVTERLRQQRAREVGRTRLEDAEVGASDVDEVGGGVAHARRDREQGDDEADADGNARGGEGGTGGTAPEVPPHEARPRHGAYLLP